MFRGKDDGVQPDPVPHGDHFFTYGEVVVWDRFTQWGLGHHAARRAELGKQDENQDEDAGFLC